MGMGVIALSCPHACSTLGAAPFLGGCSVWCHGNNYYLFNNQARGRGHLSSLKLACQDSSKSLEQGQGGPKEPPAYRHATCHIFLPTRTELSAVVVVVVDGACQDAPFPFWRVLVLDAGMT
eukprot:scaffold8242_cov99-Isochrysis_galbana.AAC.1